MWQLTTIGGTSASRGHDAKKRRRTRRVKLAPPGPHSHKPGGTYAHSPSPEPPISGKGYPRIYTPLSRVLVTVGNYKNTPFPGFLGKSSRDYGQKIPPFPEKMGTRMRPLCIRVGGGGGAGSMKTHGECIFHSSLFSIVTVRRVWGCKGGTNTPLWLHFLFVVDGFLVREVGHVQWCVWEIDSHFQEENSVRAPPPPPPAHSDFFRAGAPSRPGRNWKQILRTPLVTVHESVAKEVHSLWNNKNHNSSDIMDPTSLEQNISRKRGWWHLVWGGGGLIPSSPPPLPSSLPSSRYVSGYDLCEAWHRDVFIISGITSIFQWGEAKGDFWKYQIYLQIKIKMLLLGVGYVKWHRQSLYTSSLPPPFFYSPIKGRGGGGMAPLCPPPIIYASIYNYIAPFGKTIYLTLVFLSTK